MKQNIVFELRLKYGMNQKQFAEMIREAIPGSKTCSVDVSRWENGYHYPNIFVVRFLAEKTGKSESEVMDNLTKCLRPSKFTLEGRPKRDLGKSKYEKILVNQVCESNQLRMY